MKLCLAYILACFFFAIDSIAQTPARLIVRGDDMGYSHSGNEALIKCSREGIQTSVEVIVPSPWFPEAVRMLKENPDIDVGIHLAITSEWDNVKWRPLSDCPSLINDDGYFYPMVWPNENYPGESITENEWDLKDIEKEFRAQIELALKYLPRISHLSGHMGCAHINDSVIALTGKLAKEYGIDIDLTSLGVEYVGYDGAHGSLNEKMESFIKMLDKLKPGKTYLFVDHPGFDNEELRAIHHIGYEDVAADRQGVTSLWTSDRVKSEIRRRNIKLISYKDLTK